MPPAIGAAPTAGNTPAEGGGGGEKKNINAELWQACAGPLVSLPVAGTHVVYFPQGHSEQVAASMKKDVDAQIPNYPNLPSQLLCLLHSVTLHADPETDEVYAQMTLQPVPSFDREALLRSDLTLKSNKPQTEFFCKTLTASDTSTHGGFSVPRRAAEKIFPPLDFTMQPPAQELVARDLHDNVWTFRHIYRGQPKRHLLTTGWSLFVSGKRLFAGDSVLFIRDEKQQLLLGIRRANRQPANLSSSVLSSDSMHIGILAAAAHAAANNSPFTIFYNPRASPSEFVIPLAKYYKAVCSNQISLGMRFRMMFETEESGTRRYMGTITGIADLDPIRWKSSRWRNLQVGWDESTAGERRNRVSIWEIEPVTAPFFICPPPFLRSKRPRQPGMPDDDSPDLDNLFKKTMPWLGDDMYMKDSPSLPGLSLVQWMNMQQNPSLASPMQPNYMQSLSGSLLQNMAGADISRQLGFSAPQLSQPNTLQFNTQQLDQLSKLPPSLNPLGSIVLPHQQQISDISQQSRQNINITTQNLPSSQIQAQASILQPQTLVQNGNMLPNNLQQQNQQQHTLGQNQQNIMQTQLVDPPVQMPENQIQYQLLQKLQQQQQSLLAQKSSMQQPSQFVQLQDQQRQQLLEVSQGISRSMQPSQIPELPQTSPASLPQSNIGQQQITKSSSQANNSQFSHIPQQPKFQQQPMGLVSVSGNGLVTTAAVSGITDDVPSCSTSPSTNNFQNGVQPIVNSRAHQSITFGDDMAQSGSTLLNPSVLETVSCSTNLVKDLQQKSDIRPSVNFSRNQSQGFFSPQTYLNGANTQTDYLDTSSSTTSVCVSQNDVNLQRNNNSCSYNPPSFMMRDTSQDGDLQVDPRHNVQYGANGGIGLSKGFSNNLSSGGVITNCESSKDPQHELSSSMVAQSFGVPDVAFNSIDSRINDNSFLNRSSWAPQPQFQRMRTYTKVYKRGAVGRSIDITRYSGYDELKHDLARRFGIEGQLEDRQRVGWKLVYVDHENDVLLVGDDPWEEFVNCVRYIKILSPQEVQQMSLDGDFDNSTLPNHACSSSDNANA